jgi:hypothetical protein
MLRVVLMCLDVDVVKRERETRYAKREEGWKREDCKTCFLKQKSRGKQGGGEVAKNKNNKTPGSGDSNLPVESLTCLLHLAILHLTPSYISHHHTTTPTCPPQSLSSTYPKASRTSAELSARSNEFPPARGRPSLALHTEAL